MHDRRSLARAVWWGIPVATLSLTGASLGAQTPPRLVYPVARQVDQVDDYHGTRVRDPYRWMEDLDSPDVAQWVAAENQVTYQYLATLPDRAPFKARMTELWNYPRVSVPFWEGGHWFYRRNSGLQRQAVVYTRDALDGAERLLLDPNQLSPDGSVALTHFSPSPDGTHFAYGQSEGGSDWVTMYVREFATGANTADTIRWVKFSSASWTKDGEGFFYSRFPEPPPRKELETALRNQTLYYHRLGTPQASDEVIYARPDEPTWFVSGDVDETGRYLFVSTTPGTDKNEVYIADLGDPLHPSIKASIVPVATGQDANYYPLGVAHGRIYLRTDWHSPNRRIVSAPIATPTRPHWTDLIPESTTPIESATLVAGRIGILTLEDVSSVMRLYDLGGHFERAIPVPGLGTASGVIGRFDRPEVLYAFTAPLVPTEVFVFDVAHGTSRPFEPPHLTFDPSAFETERVFYHSKDGTRVPLFITHRRDMRRDGMNATLLYGYGGFSINITPSFSPPVIAWLERGGVYATANIRGGAEYGESWHHAGMFEKKQTVFDDFIAAAQYLIDEKITSPAHLAINGGSNGGLLVGAVMTQRPELFAVALPQVGVMDMLRYHRFSGGQAWATEYGTSDDSVAFKYLYAYSPLQNIRSGVCYPATLVTTADHDDRVVPSHSFKFTATLQAAQAAAPGCERPTLIRVEVEGSHGYRPLDRAIAEEADIYAFAAANLGMAPKQ
jgi:prolyl oligopeptidase